MRPFTTFLCLVLAGWMGGSSFHYVCNIKSAPVRGICNCEDMEDAEEEADAEIEADERALGERSLDEIAAEQEADFEVRKLEITDEGAVVFQADAHFILQPSTSEIIMPPSVVNILDSLAIYIKEHPERDLQITGSFLKLEANDSLFMNLGLSRADVVKIQLRKRDVPEDRVILSYDELPANAFATNSYYSGGIDLSLLSNKIAEGEEKALKAETRDFHFDFNSSHLQMSPSLRAYISRSLQYLQQNPDEKLSLTGHTSDEGKDAYNYKLGLERAKTLQTYFKDFGANPEQVLVKSKGEKEPIAKNDTEEGKSKNRRVVVTLAEESD